MVILAAVIGCGKVGVAPEFGAECRRGETRACDCGGGAAGIQPCVFADGKSRWAACGQCSAAPPDGGTGDTGGVDAGEKCEVTGIPAFSTRCADCHDLTALGAADSDESAGARAWASQNGPGLVRFEPAMPSASVMLDAPWKKRGRHAPSELEYALSRETAPRPGVPWSPVSPMTDAKNVETPGGASARQGEGACRGGASPNALRTADAAACSGCHPIRDDGLGHGTKTYPAAYRGSPFEGGVNCAGACHAWLRDSIVASGFEDAQGATPEHRGSGRPDALLAVSTAHRTIWQRGFRSTSPWQKIGALSPGCGGCHHAQSEKHGEVPACTACHRFGGVESEPHKEHVDRISTLIDQIDPKRPQMTACAYCHDEGDTARARSNAACYNCHLSGHQPLDANAKAHFWKVP